MVGNQAVKDRVASMVHKHLLYPNDDSAFRNVRCYGPPGVGKSHAIEIIARIFNACGMVSNTNPEEDPFVEVHPNDLLGEAVGVTERKTREFLDKSAGKVILFDEANSFGVGGNNAVAYATASATCILTFLNENIMTSVMMVAGQ